MKNAHSQNHIPPMQRLIVTLGGAAILSASMISLISNAFKLEIADWVVAVSAFLLGATIARWVLHHKKSNNS